MTKAIFDLDGTISDPAEGITRSVNHAITQLGREPLPDDSLVKYIGPPLIGTFTELLDTDDKAVIERAIRLYRERYGAVGYSENQQYDGVIAALKVLRSGEVELHIATSKRRDFACRALQYLGIADLFTSVRGCDLDRTKPELVIEILGSRSGREPAVMVGDRASDFAAAREVGIPSIGVAWGYGSREELSEADVVVDNPSDLVDTIMEVPNQSPQGTR